MPLFVVSTSSLALSAFSFSTDLSVRVYYSFHVHGLMCGLLSPILSGGSVVIPARFDKNKFWVDFAKERCSWYTAGEFQPLSTRRRSTWFLLRASSFSFVRSRERADTVSFCLVSTRRPSHSPNDAHHPSLLSSPQPAPSYPIHPILLVESQSYHVRGAAEGFQSTWFVLRPLSLFSFDASRRFH